ncbi:MAG: YggT family protein [Pseudomonadota bacterium]
MGGGYFSNAGIFLVQTIFGLLIILFLIRILLQVARANFFNPVCQFIAKATNPVLIPLKRIIPSWGRLDLAGVLVVWVLQAMEFKLVVLMTGRGIAWTTLLAFSFVELLDLTIIVFMVVIFAKVILSWVSPYGDNPLQPVLYQLSDPIMGPIQRRMPNLGGIDLSPMVALVLLQLVRILGVQPLMDVAARL